MRGFVSHTYGAASNTIAKTAQARVLVLLEAPPKRVFQNLVRPAPATLTTGEEAASGIRRPAASPRARIGWWCDGCENPLPNVRGWFAEFFHSRPYAYPGCARGRRAPRGPCRSSRYGCHEPLGRPQRSGWSAPRTPIECLLVGLRAEYCRLRGEVRWWTTQPWRQ